MRVVPQGRAVRRVFGSRDEDGSARISQRRPFPTSLKFGLGLLGLLLIITAVGPLVVSADPMATNLPNRFAPPFTEGHPLGTDQLGRDLLARTVVGFRWSMGIATVATLLSAIVGVGAAVLAAVGRPAIRNLLSQLVDTAISFPALVIAIALIAVVGRGFWSLALTLAFVRWPVFARVCLTELRSVMTTDYVTAAELGGVRLGRLTKDHLLPSISPTLTVMLAFTFAELLIAESGLSFLGIGAPVGTPAWGNMLAEARGTLQLSPWPMLVPAGAIVGAIVTANLIGDGLREYYSGGRGSRP